MPRKISLFSLVFLIVAAIDSIRNLPSAALFGSTLIFFFAFSAIVFLFPVSLFSAELASRFPEEGGIFHWVRHAFGKRWAWFAVWLQWINTMVWYPTILSFIAGTAAYLVRPSLAQDPWFLTVVILTVFWSLTLLNLKGLHVSAKLNTFCAIVGIMAPMILLIGLGGIWVTSGKPLQIQFDVPSLLPPLNTVNEWISLVAIMASFLGMELAGVHVNDIKEPQKNFPKALGVSVVILLTTMLLGSLSIAVVIPDEKIRLVDGIMQTFSYFFASFGLSFLTPFLALVIVVGSVGGMINWLISPAKGLLHAAEFGFLPAYFSETNKEKVPVRILFVQAVLVTLLSIALHYFPSVNSFYWFFTALSTELYVCMYIRVCCVTP